MTDLVSRIESHAATLPPAERRVAELVLSQPGLAAFSTVAELGRRAGTSGATVVRLAERDIVRHPLVADMLGVL